MTLAARRHQHRLRRERSHNMSRTECPEAIRLVGSLDAVRVHLPDLEVLLADSGDGVLNAVFPESGLSQYERIVESIRR